MTTPTSCRRMPRGTSTPLLLHEPEPAASCPPSDMFAYLRKSTAKKRWLWRTGDLHNDTGRGVRCSAPTFSAQAWVALSSESRALPTLYQHGCGTNHLRGGVRSRSRPLANVSQLTVLADRCLGKRCLGPMSLESPPAGCGELDSFVHGDRDRNLVSGELGRFKSAERRRTTSNSRNDRIPSRQ